MLDNLGGICYNACMEKNRPFRNEFNQRYTRQLFFECQREMLTADRMIEPMYTLYDDRPGLINFRRVYVELADPTGYQVAVRYLEDYAHWEMLMKSVWFREAKEAWDRELDAKLKSEGLSAIRMFADGIEGVSPAVQLQAAKYLADTSYKPKQALSRRGRPSKEEVQGELKQQASAAADIASDLERIRLVKG